MSNPLNNSKTHYSGHGTFKTYLSGYILSVWLTVTAYLLVVHHNISSGFLIAWVVGLALTQFIVQLVFFFQLGKGPKPHWNLFVFLFMIMVVLILVFGSLWIMSNLNYRMTPQQIQTYMNNQGGF